MKTKLIPLLVSATFLSGCTIEPGSHLSTSGKDVIEQQDSNFDIDKYVNVFPLTPRLVEQMRPKPLVAQANPLLQNEIQSYERANDREESQDLTASGRSVPDFFT